MNKISPLLYIKQLFFFLEGLTVFGRNRVQQRKNQLHFAESLEYDLESIKKKIPLGYCWAIQLLFLRTCLEILIGHFQGNFDIFNERPNQDSWTKKACY